MHSPSKTWLSSGASCEGARRRSATGSTTSNRWPSTKRAASTWPCRYFAAISGRKGCRRGSSATIYVKPVIPAQAGIERKRCADSHKCWIPACAGMSGLFYFVRASSLSVTLAEHGIERARRLAVAAFRPAGLGRRRPGENVEMQPRRRRHEAAQEQRGGDGAAMAAGADIVEVGHLRFQHLVVGPPQRQPPERVVFFRRGRHEFGGKRVVVGEERRHVRSERDARGPGQGR